MRRSSESTVAEPRTAGTIYDLGYQRYRGERLGRANAIRSLFKFSFRTAFGLGRGSRSKAIPVIVVSLVSLVALGMILMASSTGQTSIINYAAHLSFTAQFLALFAAAQAPELIVTDRQHGVLSLYLSRPMSGTDYAVAKMCALVAAMLVITLGPQLLLFGGKVFLSATPSVAFKDEYRKLAPLVAGMFVTSCFMASIGLGIASLASRRAYATAAIIALFLILPAASSIIRTAATGDVKRYAILANPMMLINGFTGWLFNIEATRRSAIGRADLPGTAYLYAILVVCAVGMTIVWSRYRKSEA
jgi:ABC-2 type transport system permease protein